jgi:hypothetical protein
LPGAVHGSKAPLRVIEVLVIWQSSHGTKGDRVGAMTDPPQRGPLPPESLASWRAARSTSANCSGSVVSRSTAIGPVGAKVAANLLDLREPRNMAAILWPT